jgi:hypothetical protein
MGRTELTLHRADSAQFVRSSSTRKVRRQLLSQSPEIERGLCGEPASAPTLYRKPVVDTIRGLAAY